MRYDYGIFFKSERFQPTQAELDQRVIQKDDETLFATELTLFVNAGLRARGFAVRSDEVGLANLYNDGCHFVSIDHDAPYDFGFFCSNFKGGHLLKVYPQGAVAWWWFRPYRTRGAPRALHDALLDIVKTDDGVDGVLEVKDKESWDRIDP